MNTRRALNVAVVAVFVAGAPLAFAIGTSSTESTRLSSNFSTWAGGKSNSDSLVTGLRSGSTISLKTTAPDGTVSTATFTPTTRMMGYGNVKHALTLAQRSLANLGITNPTAEQMQAALMGGTVTLADGTTKSVTGVLALRSSGQGWGQIAKQYDTTLGGVTGSTAGTTTAMGPSNPSTPLGSSRGPGASSFGHAQAGGGPSFGAAPAGSPSFGAGGPGNSASAPGIVNAPGGNLNPAPGNSAFGHAQGGGKGR